MWRLGILNAGRLEATESAWEAFRQGLAALGHRPDEDVALEFRSAEGQVKRLPALAQELVDLRVDVIVAVSPPAIRAAKAATTTIPIVFPLGSDPVRTGLVTSLARPGGNATGVATMSHELSGARVEILRELAPSIRRLGFLFDPENVGVELQLAATIGIAAGHGIGVTVLAVRGPGDLERVFHSAALDEVQAISIASDALILASRREIATLALRHRLLTVAPFRAYAEAGCLIAFGPSILEMYRRAATFVDRILKGADPGDLPIERPTRFELIINVTTARALGLTLPPALLARADHRVE